MQLIFDHYLFENPCFIIECYKLSEVKNALAELENLLKKGFYLAGFFSYETGYAFEKVLRTEKKYEFPLVYFGAFPKPIVQSQRSKITKPLDIELWTLTPNLTKQEYFSSIHKIKQHLSAGKSYQVNFTFKLKFNFWGEPFALYQKLKQQQPTPYSAFIKAKDFFVSSLSPELFFKKQKDKIQVKPMKGTSHSGKKYANLLRNDQKNQAENVMIVDLMRNDLGRIAKTGTVKVKKLFEVEQYKTLCQMTSTIEAKIPQDILLYDLFRNIFPSGSVTGAPKICTMQIIRELENEERKIYCGSIGFITPQKDMIFNVAIRTLLLRPLSIVHRPSFFRGEMGIGSGIIIDSHPEKEWRECLLKAQFLL